MIQVRIFSNIVVGFAYDYTISKFRASGANSTEFMFGFSPIMSTENYDRPMGAVEIRSKLQSMRQIGNSCRIIFS